MNTLEVFREIILRNELGGSKDLAYKFSDPDGVNSGKSGWSFGVSQFDTQNNPQAILCLRACEFTTDEILGVRRQDIDVAPLNDKLREHSATIDKYDYQQFHECLIIPSNLCSGSEVDLDSGVLFHLADYHNQFYMSRNGKMHRFLASLHRPVTPWDIRDFKLRTAWGRKRPDDVNRRFNNIVDILQNSI